jgi:hypothetical protein
LTLFRHDKYANRRRIRKCRESNDCDL